MVEKSWGWLWRDYRKKAAFILTLLCDWSTGGPGSPGQSQGRPYLHRHRSPPVHHPERRLDRGDSERQGHGAGHAPAAAGTERRLFHNGPDRNKALVNCHCLKYEIFL
ncbi:hypothetical protein LEMLEM_LOCUS17049 [Lemmus lemmus]